MFGKNTSGTVTLKMHNGKEVYKINNALITANKSNFNICKKKKTEIFSFFVSFNRY